MDLPLPLYHLSTHNTEQGNVALLSLFHLNPVSEEEMERAMKNNNNNNNNKKKKKRMSEEELDALIASLPPSNPACDPYFNPNPNHRRWNAEEEEEGLREEHFYSL